MALHSMPSIPRLRLRQRQQPAGERAAQRTPLAAAVGLVNGDPVQPPRLVNLLKLQAGQAVGQGRWQAAASQGSAISLTGSTAWAGASCKAVSSRNCWCAHHSSPSAAPPPSSQPNNSCLCKEALAADNLLRSAVQQAQPPAAARRGPRLLIHLAGDGCHLFLISQRGQRRRPHAQRRQAQHLRSSTAGRAGRQRSSSTRGRGASGPIRQQQEREAGGTECRCCCCRCCCRRCCCCCCRCCCRCRSLQLYVCFTPPLLLLLLLGCTTPTWS